MVSGVPAHGVSYGGNNMDDNLSYNVYNNNVVSKLADSRQIADSRQQTADSRQQTVNNRQRISDSGQQTAH
jgi:hypothetical protein